MHQELIKQIYEISKEYNAPKVKIVTNHIKICGELCECKDPEKPRCSLTLKNAKIWMLDDLCKCTDENCGCITPHVIKTEWLHVNPEKIVAFSLLQ